MRLSNKKMQKRQTKFAPRRNFCRPPPSAPHHPPVAVRSPSSARRRYTAPPLHSRRPLPPFSALPRQTLRGSPAPCRGKPCAKKLLLPQSTHKRQARRPKTGRRAALSVFLRFSQYPRQITPPAAPAGLSAQKSISGQSPAARKPRASKRWPISSSTASLSAEIVW